MNRCQCVSAPEIQRDTANICPLARNHPISFPSFMKNKRNVAHFVYISLTLILISLYLYPYMALFSQSEVKGCFFFFVFVLQNVWKLVFLSFWSKSKKWLLVRGWRISWSRSWPSSLVCWPAMFIQLLINQSQRRGCHFKGKPTLLRVIGLLNCKITRAKLTFKVIIFSSVFCF